MFAVDAMFLGKLTGLRIGHDETRLGKICKLIKRFVLNLGLVGLITLKITN